MSNQTTNETLAQRLARQMAENNPGIPAQVAGARHGAVGEREKLA